MITTNNKQHYNLVSNVPFEKLPKWFREAKTSNAKVEYNNSRLTWENGIWKNGRWKKGLWENGVWGNGRWENGLWKDGTWEDGRWENGIWENGTWENGRWEDGIWEDGIWKDGIWKDGIWENGAWESGIWKKGTWKNGIWKNGIWQNGTWESEMSMAKGMIYINLLTPHKIAYYIHTKILSIGCKNKTIEEWEEWFRGDEEFETKRGSEKFRRIENSFKVAKLFVELNFNQ